MKQHQPDGHQVMRLFDDARHQTACFQICHTKQYPTSSAETLSIMGSSLSPKSDELLEAGITNTKVINLTPSKHGIWCH